MNAHAERFNRTIQEEYIDDHEDELLDPEQFNVGLMQHLLWHNTERPHWSLKMKPPVQFIQDNFSHPECNMYVADTQACYIFPVLVHKKGKGETIDGHYLERTCHGLNRRCRAF